MQQLGGTTVARCKSNVLQSSGPLALRCADLTADHWRFHRLCKAEELQEGVAAASRCHAFVRNFLDTNLVQEINVVCDPDVPRRIDYNSGQILHAFPHISSLRRGDRVARLAPRWARLSAYAAEFGYSLAKTVCNPHVVVPVDGDPPRSNDAVPPIERRSGPLGAVRTDHAYTSVGVSIQYVDEGDEVFDCLVTFAPRVHFAVDPGGDLVLQQMQRFHCAWVTNGIHHPRVPLTVDSNGVGAVIDLYLFRFAGIGRRKTCDCIGVGVRDKDPVLVVDRHMKWSFHLTCALDRLIVFGATQYPGPRRIAVRKINELTLASVRRPYIPGGSCHDALHRSQLAIEVVTIRRGQRLTGFVKDRNRLTLDACEPAIWLSAAHALPSLSMAMPPRPASPPPA